MLGSLAERSKQLQKTLKFDHLSSPEITSKISQLARKLKNTNGVRRANKLYVDNKFPILEEFKRIIKRVENVNFSNDAKARSIMNKWVEKQTDNTIKDLFSQPLDDDTKLVLISTMHFKADWVHDFDYAFNNTFWMDNEKSNRIEFMKTKNAVNFNFKFKKPIYFNDFFPPAETFQLRHSPQIGCVCHRAEV